VRGFPLNIALYGVCLPHHPFMIYRLVSTISLYRNPASAVYALMICSMVDVFYKFPAAPKPAPVACFEFDLFHGYTV